MNSYSYDLEFTKSFEKLASTFDREEALKTTIDYAADIVDGEGCSVWLVDKADPNKIICRKTHTTDDRVVVGKSDYSRLKDQDGYYDGLTGWVFANGISLRLKNIRDENEIKKYDGLRWLDKYDGCSSQNPPDKVRPFLAVPLLSAQKPSHVIGVLRVATTKTRQPFAESDEKLLCLFAMLLSLVLSNADRRDHETELLSSLFELGTIPDQTELLNHAVKKFPELFNGSHCSILLKGKDEKFHIKATSAEHLKLKIQRNELAPYSNGQGKTGQVIQTMKSIKMVAPHGQTLPSVRPNDCCETPTCANSFIATPLLDENKNVIGVIRSARSDPDATFTDADLELLESYAKQISYMLNVIDKHRALKFKEVQCDLAPLFPIQDLEKLMQSFSVPTNKEITIMYVDLKGFTTFCSRVLENDPQQIINTMNAFLGIAMPLVARHNGTVDKFQGDGFIALFNAYKGCPDHASSAIQCALNISSAFDTSFKSTFLELMKTEHDRILDEDDFELGVKIGVGTANVIVGPVGPNTGDYPRREFTFIGQEANLISRLVSDVPKELEDDRGRQGLALEHTKKLILCTGDTFRLLKNINSLRHQVEIRGAGAGRGKTSEKRVVYQILI